MVYSSTNLLSGSISLSQSGSLRISDLCLFRSDFGTVLGGHFRLGYKHRTDFIKHLLKQKKFA